MQRSPDRIVVSPELPCRRLADDRDRHGAVRIRELAAAYEWNTERPEETGADGAPIDRHGGLRREDGFARRQHRRLRVVAHAERDAAGYAGAFHARDRLERID